MILKMVSEKLGIEDITPFIEVEKISQLLIGKMKWVSIKALHLI